MTQRPTPPDATALLVEAADTITERGAQRDKPDGERSMGRTVRAFNAMFGTHLTEQQGWQFMVMLKLARSTGSALRMDDYVDGAAYFALAGESAAAQDHVRTEIRRHRDMDASASAEVRSLLGRGGLPGRDV